MRIFLTGGTGFVGRHLTSALLDAGHEVRCLIRPTQGPRVPSRSLPDGAVPVPGDLSTGEGLTEGATNADFIFLLGGELFGRGWEDYFRVNTGGALRVAQALEQAHFMGRVAFVSSLAAAGPSLPPGKAEDDQPSPVSAYGWSKLAAEQVLGRALGDRLSILRPPVLYGPGDRGLLPWFQAARRGMLALYGSGLQPLSLLYVRDFVAALLLIMQSGASGVYHLDDGEQHTVRSFGMAVAMAQAAGKSPARLMPFPLPLVWLGCAAMGAASRLGKRPGWLNPDKYRELVQPGWTCRNGRIFELGFYPIVGLEEGLAETCRWYGQEHGLS